MTQTKRLHVIVTAEDIAHGDRGNCSFCPVARAASRALGQQVTVGGHTMGTKNTYLWARIPADVQQRIMDYDSWSAMEPFEFDVELTEDGRANPSI